MSNKVQSEIDRLALTSGAEKTFDDHRPHNIKDSLASTYWVVMHHNIETLAHCPIDKQPNTSRLIGVFHDESAAYDTLPELIKLWPPHPHPPEINVLKRAGWPSPESYLSANEPTALKGLIERRWRAEAEVGPVGHIYVSIHGMYEYIWVEQHGPKREDVSKTESIWQKERVSNRAGG